MKHSKFAYSSAIAAFVVFSAPAFAHHPLGGETPATLISGLLSGIGHPVIGLDHFAFMVAMGIAASFTDKPRILPLYFVVSAVAGCLLVALGTALPLTEFVVAASVLAVGGMVGSGRRLPVPIYAGIFAAAGLFHGSAYGVSIVGAEATPLLAYLAGFSIIQYVIAIIAGSVVHKIWRTHNENSLQPRLAGAVAAGIGLAFLVENLESVLFAA